MQDMVHLLAVHQAATAVCQETIHTDSSTTEDLSSNTNSILVILAEGMSTVELKGSQWASSMFSMTAAVAANPNMCIRLALPVAI